MRVDVSGRSFVFPYECACCNTPPDSELAISATRSWGKRVHHSETKTWDIPYCAPCVGHVTVLETGRRTALTIGALSSAIGVLLAVYADIWLGVTIGMAGVIGAVQLLRKSVARARTMCKSTCASVDRAVFYLGWHGTLHQFHIVSQHFARGFMTANQSKLVNLSVEARRLLVSSGSEIGKSTPRSPRRYLS